MDGNVGVAIVLAVVLGGIQLLVWMRLRHNRSYDETGDDYSLVNAMRMVGGIFGLLGGFMVATLWNGQADLDARFRSEVASLVGLVAQISVAAPELTAEAERIEQEYVVAVRDEEVLGEDNPARGLRYVASPRAGAAVDDFQRIATSMTPKADRSYVAFLESRIQRLAWQPPIAQIALVPAVVMAILIVFLTGYQQPGVSRFTSWLSATLSGAAIAIVAILIAMLFDADAGDGRRAALLTAYLDTFH